MLEKQNSEKEQKIWEAFDFTHCDLVMPYNVAIEIWVNTGSGNGLLPDDTKPSPEPMLTYHQWGPVIFIWGQFHKRYLSHQSLRLAKILVI